MGPFDNDFGDVDTLLNLWNNKWLEIYIVLFYRTIGTFYYWNNLLLGCFFVAMGFSICVDLFIIGNV